MKVHTDIENLPTFRNAVVTIGTFDGVHKGHRIILEQLAHEAKSVGGESVIITFHPHPRHIISSQKGQLKLINTIPEKIELLQHLCVDHLVIVPFTTLFADQSAKDYVQHFLVKYFHPSCIIIGYDHRFGKNREGNYKLMEELQEKFKYMLIEIPGKILNDITVSSTQIRYAIEAGDIASANVLLGYHYFFEGEVIEGNKLGRTIGFPTANLRVEDSEKLIPGNGVYAVRVLRLTHADSVWMHGMMNIGVRPTVNGSNQTVEVNIFSFDEEIYGEKLRIEVVQHLRKEQKFEGLSELTAQLNKDKIAAAKALETI